MSRYESIIECHFRIISKRCAHASLFFDPVPAKSLDANSPKDIAFVSSSFVFFDNIIRPSYLTASHHFTFSPTILFARHISETAILGTYIQELRLNTSEEINAKNKPRQ